MQTKRSWNGEWRRKRHRNEDHQRQEIPLDRSRDRAPARDRAHPRSGMGGGQAVLPGTLGGGGAADDLAARLRGTEGRGPAAAGDQERGRAGGRLLGAAGFARGRWAMRRTPAEILRAIKFERAEAAEAKGTVVAVMHRTLEDCLKWCVGDDGTEYGGNMKRRKQEAKKMPGGKTR